jgi:hypothetical protein
VIILLEPEADEARVREVAEAVRALGLDTAPLDDTRGRALEVVGADPSPVLRLRGMAGVAAILTRRTPLAGGEPVWPHVTLRVAILALLLLAGIALLSGFLAPGLGDRAGSAPPSATPGVEWYLRPLRGLTGLLSPGATRVVVGLFWVLFFAWPFLDRADPSTSRGRRARLALRVLGVLLVLLLVALGFK